MADQIPVRARFSGLDVVALQEFEPSDTIALSLISGFAAGVTTELGNNSISTLADVDVPAPANNEVLTFNTVSGNWEASISPGSSAAVWGNITGTLSAQTDLQLALNGKAALVHTHVEADITDLQSYLLNINSESINELSDVIITGASNTDVLQYNGSDWVNVSVGTVGITDHTLLTNIGTNTHAQIDTHIADSTVHFTEASISITESQISDLGNYEPANANIQSHIADSTVHFTEASIDHTSITNIGSNTHAQIDTHISDANIHYSDAPSDAQDYVRNNNTWVTATYATFGEYSGVFDASLGSFPSTTNQGDWFNVTVAGTVGGQAFAIGDILIATIDNPSTTTFAANWTLVPNVSVTDHTLLTNIGTNTHAQIDTHIADATIHFTQAAISITESQISDLQSYLLDITGESINDLSDVNVVGVTNGQTLTYNNGTGNWEAVTPTVSDEQVKVSANDTTAGYLDSKITAGNGIILTENNDGGNEDLAVAASVYIDTIGANPMPVYADTSRSNKVVSVETATYSWEENALGNLDWVRMGNASDAQSGYVVPFNGTIVSSAMQCENTNGNTKDIDLYINGTNIGSVGQFTGAGEQTDVTTTLNIDFTAGDKLRLRAGATGGQILDTNIQLRAKWRI